MSKKTDYVIEAYKKGYHVDKEGILFNPRGKIVKGSINSDGYRTFGLRLNGIGRNILLHRLIAFQKFGEIIFMKGVQVRHLDENSLNNSDQNITIGTQSQNMMDRSPEKRMKYALHATSFVRKYDKKIIQEFHSQDRSYKKTMEKFGIPSKGTLHWVLNH